MQRVARAYLFMLFGSYLVSIGLLLFILLSVRYALLGGGIALLVHGVTGCVFCQMGLRQQRKGDDIGPQVGIGSVLGALIAVFTTLDYFLLWASLLSWVMTAICAAIAGMLYMRIRRTSTIQ